MCLINKTLLININIILPIPPFSFKSAKSSKSSEIIFNESLANEFDKINRTFGLNNENLKKISGCGTSFLFLFLDN